MLSVCYNKGHGVVKDSRRALILLERSAKQGLPVAQYELGNCFMHGYGVDMDVERAHYWWGRAANQGYEKAKEALNK